MEHNLRCNALQCRKELDDHAVVTTCSHIFCLECSTRLQLSQPPPGRRPICPACESRLNNPDDAVITNLNPTEDYKTSVLSGLSPAIIMECTGRALSFWAYQTTQEIVYDEMMAKSLAERFSTLVGQTEKITHDANTEITKLYNKMSNLKVDVESLNKKNQELVKMVHDKGQRAMRLQELYDKLKGKTMVGHVQSAASEAVENSLQASVRGRQLDQREETIDQTQYHMVYLNNVAGQPGIQRAGAMLPPTRSRDNSSEQNRARYISTGSSQNNGPQTPSMHRQQLGQQSGQQLIGGTPIGAAGRASVHNAAHSNSTHQYQNRSGPGRQPFDALSPNAATNPSGFSGWGISGGMKEGFPQGNHANHIGNTPRRHPAGLRVGSNSVLPYHGDVAAKGPYSY